ncbi:hypothetical protein J3A83DRAFT_641001 [Scleroderma citrinum]
MLMLLLCQAAITIRVWYLFPKNRLIRICSVSTFILCTTATCVLVGLVWRYISAPQTLDNLNKMIYIPVIPSIYSPSLALYTLLFGFKGYLLATSPAYMNKDTFIRRFMNEGMIIYALNMGALIFSVVGLRMTSSSDMPTYLVASGGSVAIATTVISVCRPMLSLHSLAATHGVAPRWLLNHAELNRVRWTEGAREFELWVEVDS